MMVTRGRLGAFGALAACTLVLGLAGAAQAALGPVPLGAAQSFSVLAGAGISNTGSTRVSGDVGTFPTTTVNGAASLVVGGTNHGGDAVTQTAKTDLVTAYNAAAGAGPTNPISADLAGRTLVPGVYNSASSIGLSGALTLNGQGNPNAVFVFQAGSSLTTASASRIVLINGAQACNVFWKVGSSATLGTGSSFLGTIIALTSITVTTGVTVDGRVLARNGAVTLDTDTISTTACATTPPSTTTGTATTPTSTAPARTTPATTAPGNTAPSRTTPGSTTTPGKTTPGTTTPTPGSPAAPIIGKTQSLVCLHAARVARTRPDANSPAVGVIQATTPITGAPTVLPVIGSYKQWLQVQLPGRPNGRTGWIDSRTTTRAVTDWHLVVDTSRRIVTVYDRGRAVQTYRAVVGAPATPTPTGSFYIEESIAVRRSDVGGPYALALSARSKALETYDGGPGQIGLHGLSNIGGTPGTAVSLGCVRLPDSAMRWLAARVGAGTPVTITASGSASASRTLSAVTRARTAPSTVPLGAATSFSLLAGAGITNTGPTRISGDIGTFPTTTTTGLGSLSVGGTNHGGDAVTQTAKTDLVTAYNAAAGAGPTNPITADLAGRTLVPGVYNSASSIGLSGTLTLNGEGNANATFIFQAGSSLTTASGSRIVLINGATACNVFWQVGSSATLGTGSSFLGTIIARTSITATTGTTISGRALARNGAVTLDTDTIATPTCRSARSSTTTTTGSGPTKAQKELAARVRPARILAQQVAAKKLAAANARTTVLAAPRAALHHYALTG